MNAITKGQLLLGAAFLSLSGVAGAILLADEPNGTADTAELKPAVAKAKPAAAPKKPVDERFVIKRVLPIEGAIKYGEWHWDEQGAPKDGPIVVTVDLDARVLSIFRSGYEIGATAVLLGSQEKPTPLGMFPITQKKRHHVSNLYDAEMPYMQRLTDDGICASRLARSNWDMPATAASECPKNLPPKCSLRPVWATACSSLGAKWSKPVTPLSNRDSQSSRLSIQLTLIPAPLT